MAKRRFNDKWLEKQDPNNQLVSLWCSKKNDYTAACSFCKADISVDHMGFGSLKQHANGSKHKQLAGVSNISQEGKPKHQSSLSSFFIKSDPQPVKSETPPEKSVGASESTVKNCAWTLKQMTMKAAFVKLFVDELPKNDKNITKNDKYWTIRNALESKEVEIQMEFLISIKPIFDEFLTKFQKEEPMIHLLYPNCEKLLKLTIGRLMKNKVYKDKRGEDLKKINVEKVEMQLTSDQFKQMQGHKVVTLMESTDTDDNLNKRALLGMVSFYKAVIKYLQDNLPLDNGLLKALTCLNPREQNSSKSKEYCKTVASAMPCITGDEKVKVGDEWTRYQEIEINDDDIQGRIDHFWHRIFNIPDKCGDFFEVLP